MLVVETVQLEAVKDKFLELLNVDRPSARFDQLYAEVDEAITVLMLLEEAETKGRR